MNRSEDWIDLSLLLPFNNPAVVARIRAAGLCSDSTEIVAGTIGRLQFSVFLEADRSCSATLSTQGGFPTRSQVEAFFRTWGRKPMAYPMHNIINRTILFHIKSGGQE